MILLPNDSKIAALVSGPSIASWSPWCAIDMEPDADRIASVLGDNERTLDELRHDVQLLAKRRKLRIDMDAAPPLESERLKVEQLIVDGEIVRT